MVSSEGTDQILLAKAHKELKRAAQIRPSWSRIAWLRGLLFDISNQRERALDYYKNAIDLGDQRLGVYKRTLELMREQGHFAEANELLRQLPENAKSSDDFYRLFVEFTILEPSRKESHQHALQVAEQATANSENYLDYVWLGQMASAADFPTKAEAAFRQARTKVENAFKKGKAKAEEVSTVWVILLLFLAERDQEKALVEIQAAKNSLRKEQLPIVLAPCYEVLGKLKEAEEYYQLVLESDPSDPQLLRNVAGFYGRKGSFVRAEPLLRKLLQPETKAPEATLQWARQTLALVLSKKGNYVQFKEALQLIEENRKQGQLGLKDRQARALILATHPAHQTEAIRSLNELAFGKASLPPNLRFKLAQLYYNNGDWEQVETQMQLLLKQSGNNPVYLAFYIRGLLKQGEAFRASLVMKDLLRINSTAYEVIELQARVLHAQNDSTQAKQMLLKYARQKDAPLHRVARLLEELGFVAEAEEIFQDFVATSEDRNKLLVLARFFERQNRLSEALDTCEKAWKTGTPAEVGLAAVELVHQGKAGSAQVQRVKSWIEKAIDQHPEEEFLPILLADLCGYQGFPKKSIQIYEEILAKNENQVIALNNLAYLLAFQPGKQQAAMQTIEKAFRLMGPVNELLDTRSIIYLQQKQANKAIRDLEKALLQEPNGTRYFHLAQAYLMAGQRFRAEESFQRAIEEYGLTAASLPTIEQPLFKELAQRLKRNKLK